MKRSCEGYKFFGNIEMFLRFPRFDKYLGPFSCSNFFGVVHVNRLHPRWLRAWAHFSYCPVVLGFCSKANAAKLEKLQERALRFVYGDYETHYSKLLSQANMLSLSMYRLRFMAIEVYKCVNNLNPTFSNDIFTKKHLNHNNQIFYSL